MAKKKNEQATESVATKQKKKHPALRMIVFLLEVLLIAGGIIGSCFLIKRYNSPKITAQKYADALLAGDYETAYSYLETEEESAFLTVDSYAAVMEETGISSSKKGELTDEGNGTYILHYDNGEMTIGLTEKEEKRWFVFRDYQIEHRNLYTDEIELVAAKDLTLSLNGIVLDASNCRIDENDYLDAYETSYTIDKMFAGDYLLEVSGANYQTYSEKIEDISGTVYVETPYISDELTQTLVTRAYEELETIYQSAMNHDDTCGILEDAKAAGDYVYAEDLDYYYDRLKENLEIEDGFFEYLELKDWTSSIYDYYYDYSDGIFYVNVALGYTEDYGYQQLDWWTESYYEEDSDTSSGMANFYYAYVDGAWVLSDLYLYDGVYIW